MYARRRVIGLSTNYIRIQANMQRAQSTGAIDRRGRSRSVVRECTRMGPFEVVNFTSNVKRFVVKGDTRVVEVRVSHLMPAELHVRRYMNTVTPLESFAGVKGGVDQMLNKALEYVPHSAVAYQGQAYEAGAHFQASLGRMYALMNSGQRRVVQTTPTKTGWQAPVRQNGEVQVRGRRGGRRTEIPQSASGGILKTIRDGVVITGTALAGAAMGTAGAPSATGDQGSFNYAKLWLTMTLILLLSFGSKLRSLPLLRLFITGLMFGGMCTTSRVVASQSLPCQGGCPNGMVCHPIKLTCYCPDNLIPLEDRCVSIDDILNSDMGTADPEPLRNVLHNVSGVPLVKLSKRGQVSGPGFVIESQPIYIADDKYGCVVTDGCFSLPRRLVYWVGSHFSVPSCGFTPDIVAFGCDGVCSYESTIERTKPYRCTSTTEYCETSFTIDPQRQYCDSNWGDEFKAAGRLDFISEVVVIDRVAYGEALLMRHCSSKYEIITVNGVKIDKVLCEQLLISQVGNGLESVEVCIGSVCTAYGVRRRSKEYNVLPGSTNCGEMGGRIVRCSLLVWDVNKQHVVRSFDANVTALITLGGFGPFRFAPYSTLLRCVAEICTIDDSVYGHIRFSTLGDSSLVVSLPASRCHVFGCYQARLIGVRLLVVIMISILLALLFKFMTWRALMTVLVIITLISLIRGDLPWWRAILHSIYGIVLSLLMIGIILMRRRPPLWRMAVFAMVLVSSIALSMAGAVPHHMSGTDSCFGIRCINDDDTIQCDLDRYIRCGLAVNPCSNGTVSLGPWFSDAPKYCVPKDGSWETLANLYWHVSQRIGRGIVLNGPIRKSVWLGPTKFWVIDGGLVSGSNRLVPYLLRLLLPLIVGHIFWRFSLSVDIFSAAGGENDTCDGIRCTSNSTAIECDLDRRIKCGTVLNPCGNGTVSLGPWFSNAPKLCTAKDGSWETLANIYWQICQRIGKGKVVQNQSDKTVWLGPTSFRVVDGGLVSASRRLLSPYIYLVLMPFVATYVINVPGERLVSDLRQRWAFIVYIVAIISVVLLRAKFFISLWLVAIITLLYMPCYYAMTLTRDIVLPAGVGNCISMTSAKGGLSLCVVERHDEFSPTLVMSGLHCSMDIDHRIECDHQFGDLPTCASYPADGRFTGGNLIEYFEHCTQTDYDNMAACRMAQWAHSWCYAGQYKRCFSFYSIKQLGDPEVEYYYVLHKSSYVVLAVNGSALNLTVGQSGEVGGTTVEIVSISISPRVPENLLKINTTWMVPTVPMRPFEGPFMCMLDASGRKVVDKSRFEAYARTVGQPMQMSPPSSFFRKDNLVRPLLDVAGCGCSQVVNNSLIGCQCGTLTLRVTTDALIYETTKAELVSASLETVSCLTVDSSVVLAVALNAKSGGTVHHAEGGCSPQVFGVVKGISKVYIVCSNVAKVVKLSLNGILLTAAITCQEPETIQDSQFRILPWVSMDPTNGVPFIVSDLVGSLLDKYVWILSTALASLIVLVFVPVLVKIIKFAVRLIDRNSALLDKSGKSA